MKKISGSQASTFLFILILSFCFAVSSKIASYRGPGNWYNSKIEIEFDKDSTSNISQFFLKSGDTYKIRNESKEPLFILQNFDGNAQQLSKYIKPYRIEGTKYFKAYKSMNGFIYSHKEMSKAICGKRIYRETELQDWHSKHIDISGDCTASRPMNAFELTYYNLSDLLVDEIKPTFIELKNESQIRPKDLKIPPPIRFSIALSYKDKIYVIPGSVSFRSNLEYDPSKFLKRFNK